MQNIKDNKGKLIVVGIILIILVFTILIVDFVRKRPNEPIDEVPEQPVETKFNTEISQLQEESTMWGLQDAINNYYNLLVLYDNDQVYRLLEESYIADNNLTSDNAAIKLNHDYENPQYVIEEGYYNKDSDVTYYFIKGYVIFSPFEGGEITYYDNITFLVIVDSKSHYVIKPLTEIADLEAYAKAYDLQEKTFEGTNLFKKQDTNVKNKIKIYLDNFKTLLSVDSRKAYAMLDENTLKNYQTYESFQFDIGDINAFLFTDYETMQQVQKGDSIIYTVQKYNFDTITITEQSPMNYKIGLEIKKKVPSAEDELDSELNQSEITE